MTLPRGSTPVSGATAARTLRPDIARVLAATRPASSALAPDPAPPSPILALPTTAMPE